MSRFAARLSIAALLAIVASLTAPGFGGAQSEGRGDNPRLTSLHKAFYVIVDGDKSGAASSAVSLGAAFELKKIFDRTFPKNEQPFAIAEPSWSVENLVKTCTDDRENTLGGVVITYYTGIGTHFYLLWQSETTTFYINATVISCTGKNGEGGNPTIVDVIQQTPGSGEAAWVVRRSQVSIPLLTLSAVGSILSKQSATSKATNLTLTALAGSLFSSAGSKDIPGYSVPVRLRSSAQHIGVDLVSSMWDLCKDVSRSDVQPGQREMLCRRLHFTKDDGAQFFPAQTSPSSTP